MSHATQTEFTRLIEAYFQQCHNALSLSAPSFENDGFITKAIMLGSGGFVEIRCGPAEYNTEIFIQTQKDQRRWSLAELMNIKSIQNWMHQKRPDTSGKPRLMAEIECAFCLLVDGLRGIEDFRWVYS